MCCRYFIGSDNREIEEIYERLKPRAEQIKFGDVYPSQWAPVISERGPLLAVWGVRSDKARRAIVNARAESVLDRPFWRKAFLKERCLVPASGFYEWDSGKGRRYFTEKTKKTLYMCGFLKISEGEKRFVILTRAAYPPVSLYHERVPVLTTKKDGVSYLKDAEFATRVLQFQSELAETEGPKGL